MRTYKVAPSWRCLLEHDRADLAWVTIIIGVVLVTEAERPDIKRNRGRVNAMLDEFRADWLSMTRSRAVPGLVWRGNFELALVEQIDDASHRAALFGDLGQDAGPLVPDERMLVVHVHLVAALNDNDPNDLRAVLKQHWPGRWRTQVKSLYVHQTVTEAITSLCNYSSKDVRAYSSGGLDDVKVSYRKRYEPLWSLYVQSLYRDMDRSFRSKK